MSKKNQRQLPIISQSETIFSTRQQARLIRNEALQMIESANEFTTNTRRVNRRSAFRVISRSLHSSDGLPFSVRKHQALTELSNYIALAKYNKVVGLTAFNTDLLPLTHPRSTREHSMTASAMIRSHVQWVTDDPRITDENAKALIASAMLAPANSPQKIYALTRLENLPQGHVPLEALLAAVNPYAGKNSIPARRAREAIQLSDRFERWINMGRSLLTRATDGFRIYVGRNDGSTRSLSGEVLNQNLFDPNLIEIEIGKGKVATVPTKLGEGLEAFIRSKDSVDGYSPVQAKLPNGAQAIPENSVLISDAPSIYRKDEELQNGAVRYTDDKYDIIKFKNPKDAQTAIGEGQKRAAELDKPEPKLLKKGDINPDSGKQFWNPDEPVLAVYRRGKNTPLAFTQTWKDANNEIMRDEPFLDEDEGRTYTRPEPLTEDDTVPLLEQEELARLSEPKTPAASPQDFKYKVPEDSYEVTNPTAPYRSVSEYDDPASLANMFQGDELVEGLEDALDTGLGRLTFPESVGPDGETTGGEQEVPAEAILKAIDEKGGDAELALAQAYDKRLGTNENEDALAAQREADKEGKAGKPKKLGEVFDEVTKAPEPEAPAKEETPVAELPEITEDAEPSKLPALLEGLTEEEKADFQKNGDYTPYLPKDEPVDWPEGSTPPQDRILSEEERKQALELANSDIPDDDLIESYNGAIKNLFDEDGSAPFGDLDENNEVQTVQIPSEVLRDAIKLRDYGMDEVNRAVLDGAYDPVEEESTPEAPKAAAEKGKLRKPDEVPMVKLPLTVSVSKEVYNHRSEVLYDDYVGEVVSTSPNGKKIKVKFDSQEDFETFYGDVEYYGGPDNMWEGDDYKSNKKLIDAARSDLKALNKVLDDENNLLEEGEAPSAEEAPIAEIPTPKTPTPIDEKIGSKAGKDPLKEGYTVDEWLNDEVSETVFHDMLKKNKDFTRLSALYNDPTYNSPLMSDYQDQEMDGFESGSEAEAIDIGENGFEPTPAGRVNYALDLLENPDDFIRGMHGRKGERTDQNLRNILKSADEQLAAAQEELDETDVFENKAIDSIRATLAKEIAKLDKKIEKDKKQAELDAQSPVVQYLLRGDRLELRSGKKAPFRKQEVKDFLDENGFEWTDSAKAETKSGMDEVKTKDFLRQLRDRFGIELIPMGGQSELDLGEKDESVVSPEVPETPEGEDLTPETSDVPGPDLTKDKSQIPNSLPTTLPEGWDQDKEDPTLAIHEDGTIIDLVDRPGAKYWFLAGGSLEQTVEFNTPQEAFDYHEKNLKGRDDKAEAFDPDKTITPEQMKKLKEEKEAPTLVEDVIEPEIVEEEPAEPKVKLKEAIFDAENPVSQEYAKETLKQLVEDRKVANEAIRNAEANGLTPEEFDALVNMRDEMNEKIDKIVNEVPTDALTSDNEISKAKKEPEEPEAEDAKEEPSARQKRKQLKKEAKRRKELILKMMFSEFGPGATDSRNPDIRKIREFADILDTLTTPELEVIGKLINEELGWNFFRSDKGPSKPGDVTIESEGDPTQAPKTQDEDILDAEIVPDAPEGEPRELPAPPPTPKSEVTDKEIYDRRMAGESLQEVADDLGITRQEVRARESKYAREKEERTVEEQPTPASDVDTAPEPTAPEAAKPMRTSVRGADLQPNDVTVQDFFTITNVEGGQKKTVKGVEVPASIVSGYYPGSVEQSSKLWADDTMFEVYRGVEPPAKGDLPELRQPRREDFKGDTKGYLEAKDKYAQELDSRKATWTAPEVDSESTPAPAPKTGPHIISEKPRNLKPNDISFVENKETGELEQFFVITEVLDGVVDYTRPDNGKIEKKTIVRGYYPGHQIQENDWNEDTNISVIRGDAPENLPQPGDKPAIERIANGTLKGKAYSEKRAEITAARTAAGKGYKSPIKPEDIPASRVEKKPWKPDRPAFLESASEFAYLEDGAAILEALKGKRVLVMDFETVGTGRFDDIDPDAPIQVAGAIYENGVKVDEINLFMNPGVPLDNWYYKNKDKSTGELDPAKLLKSGEETVTDEWLAKQPSIAEQLQKFAEFAGPDAIWVAHNAEFDTNTFQRWAKKVGVDYRISGIIDSLVIARGSYGKKGNSLKELADKFEVEVDPNDLHNAATDIRILYPILEKLLLDMKPGHPQLDLPARLAEWRVKYEVYRKGMVAWNAQLEADNAKTKPEFGPEGTTDKPEDYRFVSIFGDEINEAWMLDDENTYAVNGGGTVLVDELREGDFIEGRGGYVEIVGIEVDPENSEKLLVYRKNPRTGEIYIDRVEKSKTPGVGWERTRDIQYGEVRRRHLFKDKSGEEIKSLIPEATPDNPTPQVEPESAPVKGEDVTDEQATSVVSDAIETITSGSKSDSTPDEAIKDLNIDETVKTEVIDRVGGSAYHLDANGTPLAVGDKVRNIKNGRVGTVRVLIEEFGKDKRKNYLKVKFDDATKRENAAAGSLEIIREDDGDSILSPEPMPTEMGMSLPEEPTRQGLVASRIDPTDLKVGDRLDISGKTRVSAIRVEADQVLVGTKTRGSRGGGFASFPTTEKVRVWRKPEDTPDSPIGMALPDMGAEVYDMAPLSEEGSDVPNALPEDNYEYVGEKFPPTAEQRNVLTAIMTGDNVVVRALAGTGKTSTLTLAARRLLEEQPKKKVVYVAFNKTVQVEAQGKMPANVESRTGDSIAFQGVASDITKKFKDQREKKATMKLRAEDISDELGIKATGVKLKGVEVSLSSREIPSYIKQAVNNFAISADDTIGAKHFTEELDEVPRSFVEYANAYWDDITSPSGVFGINNAHITKIWALSNPDLGAVGSGLKTPADVIFFDEAQDINPVIAKVIADQTIQKVYVGDGNQAIYAFRGAEDQLDKTTAKWDLPLTKSFRFGPEIAGMANRFLTQLGSKYRVEGAGAKGEVLEERMEDPDVVITRTNSGGFRAMIELLDAGKVVGITKGTKDELESLVASASWLIGDQTKFKKPTMHPDLAEFKNWAEVKEAVEKGEARKVKSLYDLIVQNGIVSIKDILGRVRVITPEAEKKELKPSSGFKKITLDQAEDGSKGTIGERINYEVKGTAIRLSGSGTYNGKDAIKNQKFLWDKENKQWYKEVEDDLDRQDAINNLRRAIGGFAPDAGEEEKEIDVVVTTAHKSKGLQWDNVRIFDDFWGPRTNKKTGELEMPVDEELRLAYVALTRAQKKLDPGPLNWIREYTEDEDESPKKPTPIEESMGMSLPTENVTEAEFDESVVKTDEKIDAATEKVANAILEAIERGTVPWQKPWTGGGFLPTSVATGKSYEGSNILVLWAAMEKNGWTDNRFLTYKQAEKLGGNIRRGEKGTQVIHWQPVFKEVEKPDGTKENVFVYRPPKVITLFNVEQADNVNLPAIVKGEPVPVTEGETAILEAYKDKPKIVFVAQDQAFYTRIDDTIKLPQREQFKSDQAFFETLVHELAHSTGHESRLNRKELLDNYGTHKASRGEEELIAEITVALAAARLGVQIDFENVAAYAQSWFPAVKKDPSMIVKAAKQAQKAVDYMLGKQETPEPPVDADGNPIGSGVGSEGKTGEEISAENAKKLNPEEFTIDFSTTPLEYDRRKGTVDRVTIRHPEASVGKTKVKDTYIDETETKKLTGESGRKLKTPIIQKTPGAGENAVSFIDYEVLSDGYVKIHYMKTASHLQGQGLSQKALDEIIKKHNPSNIDFGKLMSESSAKVFENAKKKYPEISMTGSDYYSGTVKPVTKEKE